jgi:hypothetical protein
MPTTNIGDHTWLARDDLRDGPIQNIEFYLGSDPLAGSTASAKTYRTTAASAAINTTETLLLAAPLQLPSTDFGQTVGGTINAGSIITITIQGTCTDTVANTSTVGIRMGILGTVAGDAAVATFVTPVSGTAGTNVPFVATIIINVLTVSATGTATGFMSINSPATGIIGAATNFSVGSAAAITAMPDTTATFFDVTLVTAAVTTTNTIQSTVINIQP